MIDIKTNFHIGSIKIEGNAIPPDEQSFSMKNENISNISKIKIKKSIIYNINIMKYYRKCFVESISIEYNIGRIKKITINFIEKINHSPCSARDTKTSKILEKITKYKPLNLGLSEVEFKFKWGKITLIYDIKTSSSTIILYYKQQ